MKVEDFKLCMLHNAASADTPDRTTTEVDVGTCRRGILVIDCTPQTDSDISDVMVYTSEATGVSASSTQCDLTKGIYFLDSAPTAPVDLTISSNVFQGIGSAAFYMIQVEGLSRYVNICYDGRGVTTDFCAMLLAYDGLEVPHAAARTAYT